MSRKSVDCNDIVVDKAEDCIQNIFYVYKFTNGGDNQLEITEAKRERRGRQAENFLPMLDPTVLDMREYTFTVEKVEVNFCVDQTITTIVTAKADPGDCEGKGAYMLETEGHEPTRTEPTPSGPTASEPTPSEPTPLEPTPTEPPPTVPMKPPTPSPTEEPIPVPTPPHHHHLLHPIPQQHPRLFVEISLVQAKEGFSMEISTVRGLLLQLLFRTAGSLIVKVILFLCHPSIAMSMPLK
jgi:hypothetical protein